MRAVEFKLQPQQVKVSDEEILADLNYPASAARPREEDGAAAVRRRPGR